MHELIDAKVYGWDPEGLQAVIDFAQNTGSAQLMIKHSAGLLIDAQFEAQPVDVFAVQKGLVAILVGIAQEKGFLEVYDHINHHLQPEWTQLSPWDEAKLNVETLLTMTTGMDDALGLLGEINKTWRYNNVAYGYLKQLMERTTGKPLSVMTDQRFFHPLGMSQTRWLARDQ
ncbi:MAG: serine hydrolase, partial [SAR86 cluster bacterium]|nr:serine hydrolase [SAR86 cluster bacterium]